MDPSHDHAKCCQREATRYHFVLVVVVVGGGGDGVDGDGGVEVG